MKKDNKGFSLVELIVVVLIMAIIAVALAPQVTKWVENSRKASDAQNIDTIVGAIQIQGATGTLHAGKYVANVTTKTWTASGTDTTVDDLDAILGDGWETKLARKSAPSGGEAYEIEFDANGTVTKITGRPNETSMN